MHGKLRIEIFALIKVFLKIVFGSIFVLYLLLGIYWLTAWFIPYSTALGQVRFHVPRKYVIYADETIISILFYYPTMNSEYKYPFRYVPPTLQERRVIVSWEYRLDYLTYEQQKEWVLNSYKFDKTKYGLKFSSGDNVFLFDNPNKKRIFRIYPSESFCTAFGLLQKKLTLEYTFNCSELKNFADIDNKARALVESFTVDRNPVAGFNYNYGHHN